MPFSTLRALVLVVVPVLLLASVGVGCAQEESLQTGPPEGWTAEGDRWWRSGVDTAQAFRDLETLEAMEVVAPGPYYATGSVSTRQLSEDRVTRATMQSLIRLFRNEPQVVDSLFERFVVPRIAEADLSDDVTAERERFKQMGYRLVQNNFQPPRTALRLGEDVPIGYPDSLRVAGVHGSVRMQVFLDEKGVPQAIELLEPVHPVLDRIAMRATTAMRWRPAYLMHAGKWRPIPSWTRFSLSFSMNARSPVP